MLTNEKMLAVIQKQASVHEARARNGRNGGIASGQSRSKTGSKNEAKTKHPETESESESEREIDAEHNTPAPRCGALLRVSSFPSKQKPPFSEAKKPTAEQEAWFVQFWDAFWLKKSRKRALDVFIAKVQSQEMFERIMQAVKSQSPEMLAREPQVRPYPETWLAEERWTDEPAEPRVAPIPKPIW
jgi:hypothetical protein